MSTLHTISKAPSAGLLEDCLDTAQPADSVLFIEDGVYHCLHDLPISAAREIRFYVLKEDLLARGLAERNRTELDVVSYDGFVELCCSTDRCVAWF